MSDENTAIVQLIESGDDMILPIPDNIMAAADLKVGDTIAFEDNKDGTFSLRKKRYVVVEAISMFKMRYVIEGTDTAGAEDLVSLNEVNDFSQDHLGELITSSREITEDEVIEMCDKDNAYLSTWTREEKLDRLVHKAK